MVRYYDHHLLELCQTNNHNIWPKKFETVIYKYLHRSNVNLIIDRYGKFNGRKENLIFNLVGKHKLDTDDTVL